MKRIISIVKGIVAWIAKNVALLIGIVESLGKLIVGIVTLTPTKKDDPVIPVVDEVFSAIKKALYNLSDWLMGKDTVE